MRPAVSEGRGRTMARRSWRNNSLAALPVPQALEAGVEAPDGVHEGPGLCGTLHGFRRGVAALVVDERAPPHVAHPDGDDPAHKEVVVAAGVDLLQLALDDRERPRRERGAGRAVAATQSVDRLQPARALGGGEEPGEPLLVVSQDVHREVAFLLYPGVQACVLVDAHQKE